MDGTILLDAVADPDGGWHPIAALGSFKDRRYGKFAITAADAEAWQKALKTHQGGEVAIDRDHTASKPAGSSRAAGWVRDLKIAPGVGRDGKPVDQVLARVAWTPEGEQDIRDGYYKFVSPEFTDHYRVENGSDVGRALVGVALTNRPFLRRSLPALNLSTAEFEDGEKFAVRLLAYCANCGAGGMADGDESCPDCGASLDDQGEPTKGAEDQDTVVLDTLTGQQRKNLPDTDFAIPEKRAYPIQDQAHARNALARVAQHGSPEEKTRVKAAVAKRYPNIGEDDAEGAETGKPDKEDKNERKRKLSGPTQPSPQPGGEPVPLPVPDDGDTGSRSADNRPQMDVKELAKRLGLAADADESKVLAALDAKLDTKPDPDDTRTLADLAKDEGKILLDAGEFDTLKGEVAKGVAAAKELHERRFEESFDAAVRAGRAAPATKGDMHELYEVAAEKTLKLLADAPAVVPVRAIGVAGSDTTTADGEIEGVEGSEGLLSDGEDVRITKLAEQIAKEKDLPFHEAARLAIEQMEAKTA